MAATTRKRTSASNAPKRVYLVGQHRTIANDLSRQNLYATPDTPSANQRTPQDPAQQSPNSSRPVPPIPDFYHQAQTQLRHKGTTQPWPPPDSTPPVDSHTNNIDATGTTDRAPHNGTTNTGTPTTPPWERPGMGGGTPPERGPIPPAEPDTVRSGWDTSRGKHLYKIRRSQGTQQ